MKNKYMAYKPYFLIKYLGSFGVSIEKGLGQNLICKLRGIFLPYDDSYIYQY